jgi:hypothetical protein
MFTLQRTPLVVAAFGSLVALALTPGAGSGRPPATASAGFADWDVQRLGRELNDRGLQLHVVAAAEGGAVRNNAYFSQDDRTWKELTVLLKSVKRAGDWRGVVYCEKVTQPGSRDLQMDAWGENARMEGPFLFFGDRELLSRIHEALTGEKEN